MSLLKETLRMQTTAPDRRLEMVEVIQPAELIWHLRRTGGRLRVGPEGEHDFNKHVGPLVIELKETTGSGPRPPSL